ncbi:MAG TPA: branched-chain amino acid ABC transporter permease, partial [Bacillota bacterium]
MRARILAAVSTPGAGRVGTVLALALALAFPPLTGALLDDNRYYLELGFNFWQYAILGLSLNVILGGAGLYNLGHAAFYAVGAYTTAILNTQLGVPTLLLLPVAALTAAVFGALISRPILHLRGDYLLIVTVGFAEILRIALRNNVLGITGGPNGILGIDRPEVFGLRLSTPLHFYYLSFAFVLLTVFITVRLDRSRVGRAWNYIREDELAAESMGIDTTRFKFLSFVIGAALAGMAGNIYAAKMTVIAPESFAFWESVVIFAIVILGGTGSIPGIFLGTFGMVVLPQLPALRDLQDARMLVFGAAMALMMVFRPQGLWPSRRWSLAVGRGDAEV